MSADLKKFGINSGESHRLERLTPEQRQQELAQNLEAYTNEVLADNPVSILYHYWPGQNKKFYTNPSLKPIYDADTQFDTNERFGLPKQGFQHLKKLLIENPDKVILWYSPAGPASFDNNPDNPYSEITYDDGQFYIQYYDGTKINALAIKISDESVIKQFSQSLEEIVKKTHIDQKSKISQLLITPVNTSINIDDFLNKPYENQLVYKDKKGAEHGLFEIINEVRNAFAEESQQNLKIDKTTLTMANYEITEDNIRKIYFKVIYNYLKSTNQTETTLAGSCGGTTAEISEIEKLLGIKTLTGQNPIKDIIGLYSSEKRLLENKNNVFECPNCHTKINTELHGPIGDECPHCHITVKQAMEKGLIDRKCE